MLICKWIACRTHLIFKYFLSLKLILHTRGPHQLTSQAPDILTFEFWMTTHVVLIQKSNFYTHQNFSERLSKALILSLRLWKSLHLMTWLYYKIEFWNFFKSPKGGPIWLSVVSHLPTWCLSVLFFQFIGQTFGDLSKCGFVSGGTSAWQFRRSLEISMFRHFSRLPICSFGMRLSRTE